AGTIYQRKQLKNWQILRKLGCCPGAPDNAEVAEGDGYTIVRLPGYYDWDLSVLAFTPTGPIRPAGAAVLERAPTFGLPRLAWEVGLSAPAGLAIGLSARGGKVKLTLEVLARNLSQGVPALPPPAADVTIRWATDFATSRDGSAVGVIGFGGELPPDE